MKWCRFVHGGTTRLGLIEDDRVRAAEGSLFEGARAGRESHALAEVRLLPPTLPFTFFAVGFNYRAHVLHSQAKGSAVARMPERPEVGYRANNALIGDGETIVIPADCPGDVEAEGELVAVIGRKARRCSRAEAEAAIFGWTIGNDVSAREWQRGDRTFWRAKNADTFKPMGPWIETEVDPRRSTTRVRVNGRQACEFATGDMIFDTVDYIVEMSRYITLHPGDVLWMGAQSTVKIAPGDRVEVEISGIGTLCNSVAAEQS
ncbi:MAG: fumarylacetoacetate hydrolase family protein [Gammaproteobacteria bacterium]|nr:fumarylacetoacetate hydrolase family protein [Gammaproteobacteria bacterium]